MQESISKPKLFKICEPEFRLPKENITLSTVFSKTQSNEPKNKRELKLYKSVIVFSKLSDRS